MEILGVWTAVISVVQAASGDGAGVAAAGVSHGSPVLVEAKSEAGSADALMIENPVPFSFGVSGKPLFFQSFSSVLAEFFQSFSRDFWSQSQRYARPGDWTRSDRTEKSDVEPIN